MLMFCLIYLLKQMDSDIFVGWFMRALDVLTNNAGYFFIDCRKPYKEFCGSDFVGATPTSRLTLIATWALLPQTLITAVHTRKFGGDLIEPVKFGEAAFVAGAVPLLHRQI